MSMSILIRNMKHPKKQSQILNIIRILIIMNSKPKNGMSRRILIPHHPSIHPTRNQNRRLERPGTFRRHKSQFIVSLHILLFHLIQILNGGEAQFLEILFDLGGGEGGDVAGLGFAL